MLGLGLNIGLSRPSGGVSWSPASMFASGEKGVWYDPSDLSTVWQDSARTTPGAVDSPVGCIDDKSGNGWNATQASAGNRPILRQAGSLYYLEFATDKSLATASLDFTGTDAVSSVTGLRKVSDAAVGEIFCLSSTPASTAGTFFLRGPGTAGTADYRLFSRGTATASNLTAASFAAPRTDVLLSNSRISTDTNELRINGVTVISGFGDQGTGNYSNNILYIGRTGGTSNPLNGWLYGLIIRGALIADQASAEAWMAAKAGVTL